MGICLWGLSVVVLLLRLLLLRHRGRHLYGREGRRGECRGGRRVGRGAGGRPGVEGQCDPGSGVGLGGRDARAIDGVGELGYGRGGGNGRRWAGGGLRTYDMKGRRGQLRRVGGPARTGLLRRDVLRAAALGSAICWRLLVGGAGLDDPQGLHRERVLGRGGGGGGRGESGGRGDALWEIVAVVEEEAPGVRLGDGWWFLAGLLFCAGYGGRRMRFGGGVLGLGRRRCLGRHLEDGGTRAGTGAGGGAGAR